ncbi:MAG: hypothetical protein BRD46_00215 [Bacteroidetes bacterium QS_8_68_15]|nr:MAG: hypothetical protein BRD46_00215 [Bacteroidetes bacterium QS_8_68_15]
MPPDALSLSEHAAARMERRGISRAVLNATVERPTVVVRQRNKRVYITSAAAVVVDPGNDDRVVTVFSKFGSVVEHILQEA